MLSGLVTVSAAKTYSWADINYNENTISMRDGLHMPWRPAADYVSVQNPPDFTWPFVYGDGIVNTGKEATYNLKVCTDEGLNNVAYSAYGLTKNYYSFQEKFETGVNYWWSVQYIRTDGSVSDWSEARRFRIDTDAYEYISETADEMVAKVPNQHPRVYATDAEGYDDQFMFTLAEFKALKNSNDISKKVYDNYVKNAINYAVESSIPSEPVSNAQSITRDTIEQMLTCAFAYLIMDDSKERELVGAHGINVALALADWDYETGKTSYSSDDQLFREVMFRSAMAYDWLYSKMTDAQRATVRNMIYNRMKIAIEDKLIVLKQRKNPFDTHRWTILGYLGISGYAILGDCGSNNGIVEGWLKDILDLYNTLMPTWSYQDGGWSQGTGYWRHGTSSNKEFYDVMALSGIFNPYAKAWANNEPVFVLYSYPPGSYGSFGDGANVEKAEDSSDAKEAMGRQAFFNNNGLARWLYGEFGGLDTTSMYSYYTSGAESIAPEVPVDYPLGHVFDDLGWAVMTNDHEDPNRIQLSFKASPFGTYAHLHADQNAFVIQAYGERLAIKSGYYDTWNDDHYNAILSATFSNNSVTVDGAKGQGYSSRTARGKISQFVNGLEFDSVTGEAAEAYNKATSTSIKAEYADTYNGEVDKFDRNIIYIRPDVFIVIDDLDAKDSSASSFEWWLNAANNLDVDETEDTALISQGKARLKARVAYPETVTATTYDNGYVNPVSGKTYSPSAYHAEKGKRVKFATEACDKTKMIVSMSVYKDGGEEKAPVITNGSSYVKMEYEDGAVVIVNTGDKETLVSVDGIEFSGTAVTYSENSIMLTNGTYLKKDGKVLVRSESAITIALGSGQLLLSGGEDFEVTVDSMNDYLTVTDISSLEDEKGRAVTSAIGLNAEYNDGEDSDTITFNAQKGNYTLINGEHGAVVPSQLKAENVSLQKSQDGAAAVFWNEKDGRSYDLKINGTVYNNVTSPYKFNMPSDSDFVSVSIKEKIGKVEGSWSEYKYLSSSYEKEKHDKIVFSEVKKDGKTYVKAETLGIPSYGFFDMYLAKYDSSGKLIGSTLATGSNNLYEAMLEKPAEGNLNAFVFGKDITPLTSVAKYNTDSTDLLGIYADGVLIEGFDNSKDSYEVAFSDQDQEYFPYITATVKDNSSKATVKYDFDNFKAQVIVESALGSTRTIDIKFTNYRIHVVTGATEETNFSKNSEVASGKASKSARGTLTLDSTTKSYKVYTNMTGGDKDDLNSGAKALLDRYPASANNHYEIESVPVEYEGYDYFVLPVDDFYNKASSYTNKTFSFGVDYDTEVTVFATVEMPCLANDRFKLYSGELVARFMSVPMDSEDFYYNQTLKGLLSNRTASNYARYYNYDTIESFVDVLPIAGVSDYTGKKEDDFIVVGNYRDRIGRVYYNYKYTKIYEGGSTVELNLNDINSSSKKIVIILKPKTVKAFHE